MIAPGQAAGPDDRRDPAADAERQRAPVARPSIPARQVARSVYAASARKTIPRTTPPAAAAGSATCRGR